MDMEFRFRAKNPITKKWNYFGIENVQSWVKRDEIQQYTGLVDKNQSPIFEGDILSTDLSRPYLVVEFRNGAFMYQCNDNGQDYYDFMLPVDADSNQDKYSVIIGNIYENPELVSNE